MGLNVTSTHTDHESRKRRRLYGAKLFTTRRWSVHGPVDGSAGAACSDEHNSPESRVHTSGANPAGVVGLLGGRPRDRIFPSAAVDQRTRCSAHGTHCLMNGQVAVEVKAAL